MGERMTHAERCARTLDLPLAGVLHAEPVPDIIERGDPSEHKPKAARVQRPAWRRRYEGMARRGKGSDAQWLAGALLVAHGDDSRAVVRRWVAEDGPRKTWGRADALLAEMGVPERVQVEAFNGQA